MLKRQWTDDHFLYPGRHHMRFRKGLLTSSVKTVDYHDLFQHIDPDDRHRHPSLMSLPTESLSTSQPFDATNSTK